MSYANLTRRDLAIAARFVVIARVPALTLLILLLAGPVLYFGIPTIGRGVLDMDHKFGQLVVVSFAVFLVEAAAISVINVLLIYGPERCRDLKLPDLSAEGLVAARKKTIIIATVPAGVLLVFIGYASSAAWWSTIVAFAIGFVIALIVVIEGTYLRARFASLENTGGFSVSLVLPIAFEKKKGAVVLPHGPMGATLLEKYRKSKSILPEHPDWFKKFKERIREDYLMPLRKYLIRVLQSCGDGYLRRENPEVLRSGHSVMLALLAVSFFTYLVLDLAEWHVLGGPLSAKSKVQGVLVFISGNIPAAAYLLLLLVLACYFLSAITFFLDRYRMPVATVLLGVFLLTSWAAPESDSFYRVKTVDAVRLPAPMDVLSRHARRPVLIAAEGGGIQAAAWTVEAIASLKDKSPEFTDHIALISGVSGGSVGALHVGARLFDGRFSDPATEAAIVGQSSLAEVAWGWTFPDVVRVILPWFTNSELDRGWALERTWERRLDLTGSREFISGWAEASEKRNFPAFIFNATWAETGKPLAISNSGFPVQSVVTPGPDWSSGILGFHDAYKNFDVRVSTAARLSSSFPYVAPAARPDGYSVVTKDRHLVDGGYYDNLGMYSLIAWLDDALGADWRNKPLPDQILILQIRSFPESEQDATYGQSKRGWFFQTYAPLDAMLHTREVGQVNAARSIRSYFADAESSATSGGRMYRRGIPLTIVEIAFDGKEEGCDSPPLSWKLSDRQMKCIQSAAAKIGPAWDRNDHGTPIAMIRDFLEGN